MGLHTFIGHYPTSPPHQLINSPPHQLTTSPPHHLITSPPHHLTNSQPHQLITSQTHNLTNLKTYKIFYKTHPLRHHLLAKIWVSKQAICCKFQSYTFLFLSNFGEVACVQHHFTFLVWSATHNFSIPIIHFQLRKLHFLYMFCPFSVLFFSGSKRSCLSLLCVFLCFSSPILPHFTLRLAPKCTAFSTKIHCVQHQNAVRLAPKCTAFCGILHRILLQIAQKLVQIAVVCNEYSYCQHLYATPFCIKNKPSRESVFCGKVSDW